MKMINFSCRLMAASAVFISLIFSLPVIAGVCDLPGGSGIGGTGSPIYDSINSQGIGGTGKTADHNGSGIGGTGKTAQRSGSGIGGTGKTANNTGIGGTGLPVQETDLSAQKSGVVTGTITGFGSICVNGIEIHYAQSTPLSIDGQAADPSALSIGQVVTASIKGVGNEVFANQINVIHAARGPIDSINLAKQEMSVLGQRVVVANKQQLANVKVGDAVNISGLRHPAGYIVASKVEPTVSLNNRVALQGPIQLTNNKVVIGNMPIVGKLPQSIQAGQQVLVTGSLERNAINVSQVININKLAPRTEVGGMVSVEGLVSRSSELSELAGSRVKLPEGIQNKLDDIDQARKVILTGQLNEHDVINVEQIRIESIPDGLEHRVELNTDGHRQFKDKLDAHAQNRDEKDREARDIEDHESNDRPRVEKHDNEKPDSIESDKHDYRDASSHEIDKHDYEKPEAPEFKKHDYEKPEVPEFKEHEHELPEIPEIESHQHELPDIPGIETHEYEAPEVPEIETHEYEAPEVPEIETHEYEAPEVPEIETHEYEAPEVHEIETHEYEHND